MAGKPTRWLSGIDEYPDSEPRRYIDSSGYVVLSWTTPEEYLRGREHRLVAKAAPGQHVHHLNGIRDDNRPENLRVVDTHAEHMALHGESGSGRTLSERICVICGDVFRPRASIWNTTCRSPECVLEHHRRAAVLANQARWAGHRLMTEEERLESARASQRRYKQKQRGSMEVSVVQ